MAEYTFVVTVETDTLEHATEVMRERVYVDEDYGFDYSIDYVPAS